MYRFGSTRTLGMGAPAGAMRGYELGASSTMLRATAGIQLAVLFVSRWRLGSGDECLCNVLAAYAEEP